MAKLGDLVVRIGADTAPLNKALGTVQRNMRTMTGNFTKLGTSMSRSITLPLAAIAGASLKLAVDFEASMAKVNAVTGATSTEFKSLEETAKRLGATTVFTASEVAGLMNEYGKIGFTSKQIQEATEATLYLAQATGSDLAMAAEVAAATLGGFGLAASETARVTDVMAASFSTSALDINHFQESMKHVAPNAKAAGVSIEEASAMLAVLSKAGIKGGQAGTSLRRILQEMEGTSGTLTDRFAELNNAGIDVQGSMDEVGRRAGTSLLILAEGAAEVQKLTDAYKDSAGSTKEMADIQNATADGSLKKLTSALEAAAIVIGDSLAPMMLSLANYVADLAGWFRELEPGTQKIVILFGALLAALGPMLLILPQIIAALPLITGAFAAMTGPIGLAVGAVVLLVAAFLDVNKQAEESAGAMGKLDKEIKKSFKAIATQTANVRFLVYQYGQEKTSLEDRKRILNDLAIIDVEHFGNLDATTTSMMDLDAATRSYIGALKEKGREEAIQNVSKGLLEDIGEQQAAVVAAEERAFSYLESHQFLIGKFDENGKMVAGAMDGLGVRGLYQLDMYSKRLGLIKLTESKLNKGLTELSEFRERYESVFEEDIEVVITPTGGGGGGGGLEELKNDITKFLADLDAIPVPTIFVQLSNGIQDFIVSSTPQLLAFLDDFSVAVENTTEKVADSVDTMANSINGAISAGVASMITGVAEMVGTAIGAQKPIENMGAFLGNALGQMAINLGTYAIAHGTVIEAIKKSLIDLGGVKTVLAGIALVALGAGIKGHISRSAEDAGIPLAEGGLIYGPTRAIVGDNKNASIDPEVVAPLSKLKGMLGGNTVQVYGRISGDDIVISNSRASRDRNRF